MAGSTARTVLAVFFASLLASPAWADDFDRRGWFVGVGGGVAVDFLSAFLEDETGGAFGIDPTGSLNVRGGYRVFSWLAFEGMYEGAYNYKTTFLGEEVATSSTHSLLANAKLIVPTWRLQPYLALGIGAQHGDFDGRAILERLDTTRWDLVLRFGFGLDAYVTKHWLVNLELAPAVRFADYSNIPSASTDQVSLTFSGGLQYRF